MDNVMIERILQRQTKANETILKELGKIIGEIGELTPSEAYTIAQQLKYGESLDKIVKTLSKYSRISEVEIYKMLEAEAKNNLALKKIYFKAKGIDYIPYKQNKALQNLVNEVAMATVNTYRNISATTGLTYLDSFGKKVTKPIKQAYMDIIDDAIMNISTGKQSFQQAMQNQLETIGNAGIQSIEYESGYHRRIDSAIRMNLQEGLSRLAEEQQELVGQQFGADGWEISVHEAPALDHELVQGHQFTNEEYAKLQDFGEAKDVNGRLISIINKYGSHRPIGELNCYHYAFSIVIGVTKPRYTQEELDKIIEDNNNGFEFEGKHYTKYQGEEMMRRFELEMRKARETNILAKAKGDEELADKSKRRMDILARKYYNFSKTSGLPTRIERIKAMVGKAKEVESMAITKSEPVIVVKNEIPQYKDLTNELKELVDKNKNNDIVVPERRLSYSMDKDKKIYNDWYFDPDDDIQEEINYQKLIEKYTGYKTYLNAKTHTQKVKTPDFWIEEIDELWDLKDLDGDSESIIDNVFNKKSKQTYNLILKKVETSHTIEYLKDKITEAFEKGQRKKIKQVILLDDNDNVILYYKR